MNIVDGAKLSGEWVVEHYGQNPAVVKYLDEHFCPEEKNRVREFMNFLSDTYPAVRPFLFGPPKSVEVFKEG